MRTQIVIAESLKNMVKFAPDWAEDIQRRANTIACRAGHGRADVVRIGARNRVLSHTAFGYRKYTTGEYVPNAYLANFGWKNTYYQHAETVVEVTPIPESE